MAQGRFTLASMSHDHLHGLRSGLPMIERVNLNVTESKVIIFSRFSLNLYTQASLKDDNTLQKF